MTVSEAVSTIKRLNSTDRARAIQEIMEGYLEDCEDTGLTEVEQRHLDRVLAEDAADTTGGRDWEEVEAELIAREKA